MNALVMPIHTKSKSAPHRGWALASTGAALLILIVLTVWGTSVLSDYFTRQGYQIAAGHMSRFQSALTNYVGRYYDTLLATSSTTTPVMVTTAMLKNTGFLPAGFADGPVNGQSLVGAVIRNAVQTDQLQALVVTQGGNALPFDGLRFISAEIEPKSAGGYIWTEGTVTGARGNWSVPLASFGLTTSPGHLAVLLSTDDLSAARTESDRLYRFSVTGKPDLNRMHTDIDMGSNSVNNANAVNAQTGNFSANVAAGGTVTAGGNVTSTNGWLVSNRGWLNQMFAGGFYMSDNDWVRSVNDKNIYTGGMMLGGSVRANGRLSSGEVLQLDQVNTAGAGCGPNGLVSRDGSGGILSCKDGIWTASSGKATNINVYQCPYSICDNNSASTCAGQLSTQPMCQCRASGGQAGCDYVGKLIVGQ